MLVSDFIQEVNDVLRSIDDDVPTTGTEEYNYWIRTANRIRRTLYRDVTKTWASTYAVLNVGTVAASATPTFNLSATFLSAAVNPYIIDLEGHRHELELKKPKEVNPDKRQVFIAGQSPQVFTFSQPITADETIIGGTLYLPGYFQPAAFDSDGDTVVVDDEDWLITATAAKIAAGDLTYEDRAPDLNSEANSLYSQMIKNNRRGVYSQGRITPTNVKRITTPDR